ncbi:hypothetical protein [Actinoplanes couchii]|uniref:hypothetical protein n=1 Tax=Actinoplanes couchii TaxID=403638 RepID=UPI0019420784|nr:hypothetical protein [Actinoplanes couchii]MDR6324023.1 hypothetical protein [Actinoplanes couchii]
MLGIPAVWRGFVALAAASECIDDLRLCRFPHTTLLAVIRQRLNWGLRQFLRRARQQLASVIGHRLARIDRRILIGVQIRQ